MVNDTTKQRVLFKGLSKKTVDVRFDQDHASSDAGAMLLKACDTRLGISQALADCLVDTRQPSKVQHSCQALFAQRLFAIACGYADANDAARLAHDPVFKLLCDRDALDEQALASQPTLSRFENAVDSKALFKMGEALTDTVIARHRRRLRSVKLITLDFDPTDDHTHGQQQLSLFNRLYDSWCYLPLAGFMTFNNEREQYLFNYLLRPGNAAAKEGLIAILKRLIPRLRQAFPKAKLRIRLDAGFRGGELYEYFESQKMEYVVCIGKNAALDRLAEPYRASVREAFDAGEHRPPCYAIESYWSKSWKCTRRVVIKASVVSHDTREPKDNVRYIVTNIKRSAKFIYETIYCARGDVENRIKELKKDLAIDRTSCSRFYANQFRALMTACAYVLFQELRLKARYTDSATAQVNTLRLRLLKIGVWVESSVRRIVMHLPTSFAFAQQWLRIAKQVGAVPP